LKRLCASAIQPYSRTARRFVQQLTFDAEFGVFPWLIPSALRDLSRA